MFLRELDQVRGLLGAVKGSLTGVGITAFPRIIPSYFLDSYRIIAWRKTADLALLRKKAEIFCLEEDTGGGLPDSSLNSACLLAHGAVTGYLNGLSHPRNLLLYQNYPELERLAGKEQWNLLANGAALRLRLRQRAFFQHMGSLLNLPLAPGGIWPLRMVHERSYRDWASMLGPDMVFQFPDIGQGGGRGTFFIRSAGEYKTLVEWTGRGTWRGVRLRSVSIRRFMEGVPASMALCITRHGILRSGLQEQLVDLPYCGGFPENGVFCGHSWGGRRWPPKVQDEALRQAGMVGEYLSSLGYRGIFGIDFIVQMADGVVCPIEINPRFTGAFPMLSLLHLKNGIIPIDIFHMIEFMDIPYKIDVEEQNRKYAMPVRGSHLLLFFPRGGRKGRYGSLRPGLYQYGPDKRGFLFIRGAAEYGDMEDEEQFVLVDGPPENIDTREISADPLGRLCHILFSFPVVDGEGAMHPKARAALDWIYGDPAPVERGEETSPVSGNQRWVDGYDG